VVPISIPERRTPTATGSRYHQKARPKGSTKCKNSCVQQFRKIIAPLSPRAKIAPATPTKTLIGCFSTHAISHLVQAHLRGRLCGSSRIGGGGSTALVDAPYHHGYGSSQPASHRSWHQSVSHGQDQVYPSCNDSDKESYHAESDEEVAVLVDLAFCGKVSVTPIGHDGRGRPASKRSPENWYAGNGVVWN